MRVIAAAILLLGAAVAQDTYYCPDGGWIYDEEAPRCYLIQYQGKVSKPDAVAACAAHGAILVEPRTPRVNRWLEATLLGSAQSISGFFRDFWIGAYTEGRHDENHEGVWYWDSDDSVVDFKDWHDGEPNDWHRQHCVTFLEFGMTPGGERPKFRWNDFSCDGIGHYICQKEPRNQTEMEF